jgi:hypothetical protein
LGEDPRAQYEGSASPMVLYTFQIRALVESDATRMWELLIGLPVITVLGIVVGPGQLMVHVEASGLARGWLGYEIGSRTPD